MLIVVEGIDGTGKSTQVRLLGEALSAKGFEVVVDKEPTDGPIGKKLRDSAVTGRLSAGEELALFHEDRRQHVEEVIAPALARGAFVVLDRYYFSTMAYQGIRGFDPQEIRRENEGFAPVPDLVIVMDLPVDEALRRIGGRDGAGNEFETREFLESCDEVFRALEDDFVVRVDASGGVEEVHQLVMEVVEGFLHR